MYTLWQSFFALLATSTETQKDQIIEYLKTELDIARSHLPKRVVWTTQDKRRLLAAGIPLGAALKQLISLVTFRTFQRWLAQSEPAQPTSKVGRPRIDERLRQLILRIADQVGCGYSRILGELRKLGVDDVCESTIKNVLKDHHVDPAPQRGTGSWAAFVRRHKDTLWACDFLQTKIWTLTGLSDYFLLFFIHIGSRRVYLAGVTAQPTAAWVAQQATTMAKVVREQTATPRLLLRDRDGKFPPEFDQAFAAEEVEVIKTGPQMPNMNAHMERWIQSFEVECLNHFVVLGEKHLLHLAREYIDFYNTVRPHQSLDNQPLSGPTLAEPPEDWTPEDVVFEERLGGVLQHCRWKNAA